MPCCNPAKGGRRVVGPYSSQQGVSLPLLQRVTDLSLLRKALPTCDNFSDKSWSYAALWTCDNVSDKSWSFAVLWTCDKVSDKSWLSYSFTGCTEVVYWPEVEKPSFSRAKCGSEKNEDRVQP